jgi:hypothetical protein
MMRLREKQELSDIDGENWIILSALRMNAFGPAIARKIADARDGPAHEY